MNDNREAPALKLIGASFFLLALYVFAQSAWPVAVFAAEVFVCSAHWTAQ